MKQLYKEAETPLPLPLPAPQTVRIRMDLESRWCPVDSTTTTCNSKGIHINCIAEDSREPMHEKRVSLIKECLFIGIGIGIIHNSLPTNLGWYKHERRLSTVGDSSPPQLKSSRTRDCPAHSKPCHPYPW